VFSVTCVSAASRGMVEANVQKTTEICSRPCSPETAGQTLVSLTVVLEMSHSATLDLTISPVVRWSAPTTRFSRVTISFMSWVAQSVCVWLRAGRPGDRGSIPGRGERLCPLISLSRPALGPTQSLVQWVPEVVSSGVKRGRGVILTTHDHLVPRSRMSRSYTSSPKRLRGM
jgi:hypothetical protein